MLTIEVLNITLMVPPLDNHFVGGIFSQIHDDIPKTIAYNQIFRETFINSPTNKHDGYQVSIARILKRFDGETIDDLTNKFVTIDLVNSLVLKRIHHPGTDGDMLSATKPNIFFVKDRIGIPRVIEIEFDKKICLVGAYSTSEIYRKNKRGGLVFFRSSNL